ncbi:hypothetical protein WICMUC_004264 [Wickerhamomyces mucosus]|uniref:Uncharacterized protein n=1 Tax=Wickerhamomyces mucosus TaxID=1378264 RepID=A0A9P8PHN2_9ASCO|nr:hypothetical protein WICMUC_004264 [Wickerhamomyces mucosus]
MSSTEIEHQQSYKVDFQSNIHDLTNNVENIQSDFAHRTAMDIAKYLDKKHNNVNFKDPVQKNPEPHDTPKNERNERPWTPMFQSTPMEDTSTKVQPKDMLKAKSKLSQLSALASFPNTKEDEYIDTNIDDNQDDESDFEDTPSKPKTTRDSPEPRLFSTAKDDFEKLKDFLSKIPNGELILNNYKSPIINVELIVKSKEEIDVLHAKNEELNNKLKDLTRIENTNTELTTEIKSKDQMIDNLNSKIIDLSDKLEKKDTEYIQLKDSFDKIKGEDSSKLTEDKSQILNKYYNQLGLSEVEKLSQIESHNIIKNVLILLRIKYSELKKSIPKLAKSIAFNSIYKQFFNNTHLLIYENEVDPTILDNNGYSHLRDCAQRLLDNIETIYNSSYKDN